MSDNTTWYSPGGGLLRLNRDLTDSERQQYIDFLKRKGVYVTQEDVVIEDGGVIVKKWSKDYIP